MLKKLLFCKNRQQKPTQPRSSINGKTIMKTILALLTLTLPLLAVPRVIPSNSSFNSSTYFSIVFDKEMVTPEKVGKTDSRPLLQTTPSLKGTYTWKNARTVIFKPSSIPKMGTSYTFHITPGLQDLEGTALPKSKPIIRQTSQFTQVRHLKHGATRQPKFTVIFNDSVDPTSAAPYFHFRDKANQVVAANVRRATWADHRRSYYLYPTWQESFSGWKRPSSNSLADDAVLPNCLVVEPISPLPVGDDWALLTLSGLPNKSATAKLPENAHSFIGKISPFQVKSVRPIVIPNKPRYLLVNLNQSLPESITPAVLKESISITPAPDDLKISLDQRRQNITITGDFSKQNNWHFNFAKGLTSTDGLTLEKNHSEDLTFHRISPGLSTPSHEQAQLANGSRTYEISSLNLKSYHLRIKRLNPTQLVRAYQGYRHYTGDGHNNKRIENLTAIPYALVAGETVFDEVITIDQPLDHTHTHLIHWDNYLPEGKRNGLFFISAEGQLHDTAEFQKAKAKIVQSLVQLTDIGLAWKLTDDDAFVYAYSCQTGKPLPHVVLNVFGEDAKPLHQTITNEEGVVRLPRGKDARHLRASLNGDHALIPFDDNLQTISLWRYPVRYSYDKPLEDKRSVLLFTDRNLYRPGETMRLKGLVRHLKDNDLHFPESKKPSLVITDSAGRDILEQDVTLSDTGSFDLAFNLPATTVGRFHVNLSWPDEIDAANELDSWRRKNALKANARFHHSFHVQEFKRNAFEPKATLAVTEKTSTQPADKPTPDTPDPEKETAEKAPLPSLDYNLAASYYQGTAVAKGTVEYYLSANPTGFYPEKYRDYLFADHRRYDSYYWYRYYGYGENDYYSDSNGHDESGEAELDEDGKWARVFDLPSAKFPSPNRVRVTSEITDTRNQTLTTRSNLTVHPSDFYLGLLRQDKLNRINEIIPFKVVTVKNDGTPYEQTTEVTLSVEREVHTQTKSKAPNGKVVVKNESHTEPVHQQTFTLTGNAELPFTPTLTGKHTFTLSTKDASGRPVKTVVTRHIYGSKEYPWAYEDGQRIKLVAEQKRYQAGDTARILVLTPIEGNALVTVERDGVLSHFNTFLRSDNPVIEVPVTEEHAPNAFVSVMIIKGAQDSLRKNKEPQLRIGYCELTVDPSASRLTVKMETASPYTRPGENISVSGTVTDHQGQPVSNAEIVFYAEDEGTLAVVGYTNPNPLSHFYAPRSINTEAGTSLSTFMPETPAERFHANKGFFIGGGGEGFPAEPIYDDLRRDFDPCAAWFPKLKTKEDGTFTANFPAPDTLTRYRLIAVAHHAANQFGTAQAEAVVNKPVMLEPNPPRFANQGDHLQPTALIQNTTDYAGTWKVTLQLDSLTTSGKPTASDGQKLITREVQLDAKGQAIVPFDLHFEDTGEANWIWHTEPVSLQGFDLEGDRKLELSDTVQSTFQVNYPMPLLRERQFISFRDSNEPRNLLNGYSKELLEGKGELELDFSRTRLLEAGGAIDYLLHYPYGCVEQTTSSTIPWIAAKNMRHISPKFQSKKPAEIQKSIQAGADRLLSMQTTDGGLSYWPGDTSSTQWASSYGGFGLILCREAGATIPAQSLENLARYLENNLKGSGEQSKAYDLEIQTRALYVLACLGKPEKGYMNTFLARADSLSMNARIFLALALHKSGETDLNLLVKLINEKPTGANTDGYWMRYRPIRSLPTPRPLHYRPQQDPGLRKTPQSQLLGTRSSQGHWRTTWCNAWSLLAMGAYAKEVEKLPAETRFTITTADGSAGSGPHLQKSHRKDHPAQTPPRPQKSPPSSAARGFTSTPNSRPNPKSPPFEAVSKNGFANQPHSTNASSPMAPPSHWTNPKTGDLVKVTLDVHLPQSEHALPRHRRSPPRHLRGRQLPTSPPRPDASKAQNRWEISNHRDPLRPRPLLHRPHLPGRFLYKMTYHARITTSGSAYAPPAKVEEMYAPENYALSQAGTLTVHPSKITNRGKSTAELQSAPPDPKPYQPQQKTNAPPQSHTAPGRPFLVLLPALLGLAFPPAPPPGKTHPHCVTLQPTPILLDREGKRARRLPPRADLFRHQPASHSKRSPATSSWPPSPPRTKDSSHPPRHRLHRRRSRLVR